MLNAPKLIARSQNVAFDGVHFNSVGYKIAGADAKDAVLAHLKAVEWAEFKSILSADKEYIADMQEKLRKEPKNAIEAIHRQDVRRPFGQDVVVLFFDPMEIGP